MTTKNKIAFLLFCAINILPIMGQVTTKSVNVTTAGTLSLLINTSDAATIVNLTVSGNIDTRDFVFMRDKITRLSTLDLTNSKIKAYTGSDGSYSGVVLTYPADQIPLCAFYNANTYTYKSTLTNVKLPSTLGSIGGSAFYYCYALAGNFVIPASVKSIGDYALYGCTQIAGYQVDAANTRYSSADGVLFNKKQDTLFVCPSSKAGAYTIPSTVVCIANSAFEGCSGLTGGLTIPTSVKSIGSYAFYYCSGLSGALSLPNSLTYIGDGAFYGCSGLTGSVNISSTVGYIGSYAFFECNKLSSFQVNSSNSYYSSSNDVLFNNKQDTLLICPAAKVGSYAIPTTVKGVGSYAFYNCSSLTGALDIPQTVGYIGSYAFYGVNQISAFNVDQNNSVYSSIDGVLFTKKQDTLLVCPATKTGSYVVPNSVKAIGTSAFYGCSNLTGSLSIPASVNTIGNYAFYGCNQVASYDVNAANSKYSSINGVLFNKQQDSLLICPPAKTGSYAVPLGVKHVGTYSFYYCNGLTGSISLPATLNTIGDYAFYGCSNLTSFNVETGNKYYSAPDGVLMNQQKDSIFICPAGKTGEYQIPSSVVAIDYSAFSECVGLTNILFPPSVKSVGSYAFYYCTGLSEIILPTSITTIGSGAFYGCSNLKNFGIKSTTPPLIDGYTFAYVDQSTCKLLLPIGLSSAYSNALYWKNFSIVTETDFLSVPTFSTDRTKIYASGRNLVVEGVKVGDWISIYGANGELVASKMATANRMTFPQNQQRVCIVKAGVKSAKVVF